MTDTSGARAVLDTHHLLQLIVKGNSEFNAMLQAPFQVMRPTGATPNAGFFWSIPLALLLHALLALVPHEFARTPPSRAVHFIELAPEPAKPDMRTEPKPAEDPPTVAPRKFASPRPAPPARTPSPRSLGETEVLAPTDSQVEEAASSAPDLLPTAPSHENASHSTDPSEGSSSNTTVNKMAPGASHKRAPQYPVSHSPSLTAVDWGRVQTKLQRAIAAQQRYPQFAQKMGFEGNVHVRFSLARDGTLLEPLQVVRSSGYAVLDREALRMVRRGAPYTGLLLSWRGAKATFEVPIGFHLQHL
jgi:periplasmic protein TonB